MSKRMPSKKQVEVLHDLAHLRTVSRNLTHMRTLNFQCGGRIVRFNTVDALLDRKWVRSKKVKEHLRDRFGDKMLRYTRETEQLVITPAGRAALKRYKEARR